ncbi:MAG: anti-sigma factor [Acidobacteriota bacterium]
MLRDSEEHEQHVVERALGRLQSGWDPQSSPVEGDEDESVRAVVEAAALMAYDLEPESPSPAVRERLLASLGGGASVLTFERGGDDALVDRTLHGRVAVAPTAEDWEGDHPADRTLVGLGSEGGAQVVPIDRGGWGRGMMAMAASLVLCLVAVGYLLGQLRGKNETIASQRAELVATDLLRDDLEVARRDLVDMHDRFEMVTTVARQAYPMDVVPVSTGSPVAGADANGIVFVCGRHQQWLLTLGGLESAPAGKEYRLWFVTDDGEVDGGSFNVSGGMATVESPDMPDGTRGFGVTLEDVGHDGGPEGPWVLLGDDAVRL